jgi:hypothetical protein
MADAVLGKLSVPGPVHALAELTRISQLNEQMRVLFPAPAPYVVVPPGPMAADQYNNLVMERNQAVEGLFQVAVGLHPAPDMWTARLARRWDDCLQVAGQAAELGLRWPMADISADISTAVTQLGEGPGSVFSSIPLLNPQPENIWLRRYAEIGVVTQWLGAMVMLMEALPALARPPVVRDF